jgi:leucyl/phenylalanyl-tRNA---protein transferase
MRHDKMTGMKKYFRKIVRRVIWLALQQDKQLKPENLLARYRSGYSLMTGRLGIINWLDPDQRAIMPLDDRFLIGKHLAKKIRSNYFEVSFDRSFRQVVEGCAELHPRRRWTWISPEVIDAMTSLHQKGYAHSVEIWRNGMLVGGAYGIAIGGYFSGESMFAREHYANKVAMVTLVHNLRKCGFSLLDSLELGSVAREFGAYEIPRDEYKVLLADALSQDVKFAC